MEFPQRPGTLAAFGAAIRRRRNELAVTLDQVAAATGISKPYLSTIETGRTPGPPSEEKLRLLAGVLEIPREALLLAADWLRTPAAIQSLLGEERGEMPRRADGTINLDSLLGKGGEKPAEGARADSGLLRTKKVPLINRVAAGGPAEFTDMDYPAGVADAYIPAPDSPDAESAVMFALRVTGDSMVPEYQDGEILLVGSEAARPAKDGEDCVVRFSDSSNFATTFKRIYFLPAGAEEPTHLRLVPLNRAHAEWTAALEEVTGVYPVLYRLLPARKAAAGGGAEETREPQFSLEND